AMHAGSTAQLVGSRELLRAAGGRPWLPRSSPCHDGVEREVDAVHLVRVSLVGKEGRMATDPR
ncbi:MAG: hypothetical protein ACRD15_04480, partial [Vicinamibacterales bacterium]